MPFKHEVYKPAYNIKVNTCALKCLPLRSQQVESCLKPFKAHFKIIVDMNLLNIYSLHYNFLYTNLRMITMNNHTSCLEAVESSEGSIRSKLRRQNPRIQARF